MSTALIACGDNPVATADKTVQTDVTEVATTNTGTEKAVQVEAAEWKPFLADAGILQKAEDALKALPQFKGKPLSMFQNVNFYDGEGSTARIEVDVQDPNN